MNWLIYSLGRAASHLPCPFYLPSVFPDDFQTFTSFRISVIWFASSHRLEMFKIIFFIYFSFGFSFVTSFFSFCFSIIFLFSFIFHFFQFFLFFFRFLFLQTSFFSFQTSFFSFQTSFFSFFYHFFSFSFPVAPEIQENHEKQWKTMENHQKQRKMKKKWSCKWKKNEILDSKLQILTPNQEIFKNSRIFFIVFSFFFHFPFPWHLKSRKTMKNNEKQWKTIKNKGTWKKMKLQMKKKWKFGLKVADSHSEPGNLQKPEEIFIFFMVFSFSFPVAPEIQENHEKQWKTHQKQRKMKKTWSCKWKNMKIWTQSCRFSLRTRKSSKTRGNFHFFSLFFHFFFIFLSRGTWNPGKPWKTMKNNGKPSKTKENEKKWSCKWKKWKFGLKVADSHSEPGNLQKLEEILIFFIFFHCFFIFLSHGTWNPGKPWKTMKNNGKPSKTKEHEKKWSCKWKKNENLDSKLQILTPNREIFKNSRKFSFFSFFFIFLARGTWNPGKPWKTMKNHQKQRKWKKLKLQMKKMKLQMKKMKLQMKKWSLMAKGDEQKWKKWR